MTGRIHSIQAENTGEFIENFDRFEHENGQQIFISRYPQSRLIDLLDISEIRCYWLTATQNPGVLEPSLEKINHFVESTIDSDQGSIFFEGIEWLVSLHGFDAVHSMLRALSEKVSMSEWSILISVSKNSFERRELSRFYREAPLLDIQQVTHTLLEDPDAALPGEAADSVQLEIDLNDDGTPKLVFLTRLPRSGFTKQILQRRILQWRRMGLDTSDIEATLYLEDDEQIYSEYRKIEEIIRRATELERYVIESVSDSQERTVALFRIRQLTGLDELEAKYFSD